jgi:enolase
LRDNDASLYKGKSVFQAIGNLAKVNRELSLAFHNFTDLKKIDEQLCSIDGTKSKSVLGGNLTTAISFCMANAAAKCSDKEMFEFFKETYNQKGLISLPTPLVNIINGGKHGVTDDLKIQEFMIFPNESYSLAKKMQIIAEVYQTLKDLLVKRYGKSAKSIGDEGGFCPPITNPDEALFVIEDAIAEAHYVVNEDVFLALDCAASEFYNKETGQYEIEKDKHLTSSELVIWYKELIDRHPALKSIEDPFDEHDYEAWAKLTQLCGDNIMIVGDDLFTTNPSLIRTGLESKWANALLLKVNQIGTVSEAVEAAHLMMEQNKNVIVSHRSGETNHAFIVDLAVGIGAKFLKIGSPCRGERVAKFNRLIEIDVLLHMGI